MPGSRSASFPVRAAFIGASVVACLVLEGTAAASRYYGCNVSLTGNDVVPPNASGAYGYGSILIDTDVDQLRFDITLVGLVGEIESHIHGFAAPGHNAPVIVEIPTGDHKLDVWNYVDDEEPNILAGLSYVVVHTFAYPGGELRGQIVPAPLPADIAPSAGVPTLLLAPPRPNPASGIAEFGFSLPRRAVAHVFIADVRGRRIVDLMRADMSAGPHVVRWNGRDATGRPVTAGLYAVCLEADGSRRWRKLAIVR